MAMIGDIIFGDRFWATMGAIVIIAMLVAIIYAMNEWRIDFADRSRVDDARKSFEISGNSTEDEPASELGQLMKRLWRDRGVQVCL